MATTTDQRERDEVINKILDYAVRQTVRGDRLKALVVKYRHQIIPDAEVNELLKLETPADNKRAPAQEAQSQPLTTTHDDRQQQQCPEAQTSDSQTSPGGLDNIPQPSNQ